MILFGARAAGADSEPWDAAGSVGPLLVQPRAAHTHLPPASPRQGTAGAPPPQPPSNPPPRCLWLCLRLCLGSVSLSLSPSPSPSLSSLSVCLSVCLHPTSHICDTTLALCAQVADLIEKFSTSITPPSESLSAFPVLSQQLTEAICCQATAPSKPTPQVAFATHTTDDDAMLAFAMSSTNSCYLITGSVLASCWIFARFLQGSNHLCA
eukprot:2772027-Rhodomonas_salina.3